MTDKSGHPEAASDRALVQAYQAGDPAAYDAMYRRYVERVRRTCGRVLINRQDAEEATQETFLRAYQALGRFNGQYQLGAWLTRIAANVSIDLLRSRSRSAHLVGLPSETEAPETQRGPEELVAGGLPRVDHAMEELQPLHARALELRAIQGLSHDEMAGHLDMSPAQVKALLHRARRSFKRAWEKAEGWALAPLLALRWPSRPQHVGHASTSASNLAAIGATGVPVLVERAAATAMLVVVALTGVTSNASSTGVDGFAALPPIAGTAHAGPISADQTTSETAEREASVAGGSSVLPIDLPGDAEALIAQDPPDLPDRDKPKPRRDDDDDDDFPFGPGAAEKKVLEDVEETVDDIVP